MLNNEIIIQETRRFDDTNNSTVSMRSKSDALSYKYFREPNIMPIQLDKEWVNECIINAPELADVKRDKYINEYNLSLNDANIILTSIEMSEFWRNN